MFQAPSNRKFAQEERMSTGRLVFVAVAITSCSIFLAFRYSMMQNDGVELRLLNGRPHLTDTQPTAQDTIITAEPTQAPVTQQQQQQQQTVTQDIVKQEQRKPAARQPVELKPTYEIMEGTEVVWQAPPNPKGVLFVAHGCNHGAIDWFHKDGKLCPACIGLPVEVNITTEALARGYAVVAMSSFDRDEGGSRCWFSGAPAVQMGSVSPDSVAVREVLLKLLPRQKLDKLPVYALGASSGGQFVLTLAMANGLRLAGVCSQIMGARDDELQAYFNILKAGNSSHVPTQFLLPYPPTMFVHMPRDTHTAGVVASNLKILQAQGVPSKEVQVHPAPLTPELLHKAASKDISLEQSTAIYKAFKDKGLLDAKDLLANDPRRSGWRNILKEAKVPGIDSMRLQPDESAVAEVLNVLFAGHEIISSTTTDMLDWFESLPAQTSFEHPARVKAPA